MIHRYDYDVLSMAEQFFHPELLAIHLIYFLDLIDFD